MDDVQTLLFESDGDASDASDPQTHHDEVHDSGGGRFFPADSHATCSPVPEAVPELTGKL